MADIKKKGKSNAKAVKGKGALKDMAASGKKVKGGGGTAQSTSPSPSLRFRLN